MKSNSFSVALAAALLAGCGAASGETDQAEGPAVAPAQSTATPRFDHSKVAAARAAILAEPRVRDLLFDDSRLAVTWQVGTIGVDPPAYGHAESVCILLSERHLVDADTKVRIVDFGNPAAHAGDFRAASLGQVNCATGARSMP